MSFHANPPMIDPENKEKLIRTRPNELGFDLEKDGFDYSIRDRREKYNLPALQPTRCRDLDMIVEMFGFDLRET